MRDLTDAVPVRRMSVARGRLEGFGPSAEGADLGHAEAAAELAVKAADRFVVGLHAAQVTHVDTLVSQEGEEGAGGEAGGGLSVTVTVQGHARADLDSAALSGVCAALLTLRHALGVPEARLVDLHLVQNVA